MPPASWSFTGIGYTMLHTFFLASKVILRLVLMLLGTQMVLDSCSTLFTAGKGLYIQVSPQ